jgi:hypothetical protein
MIAQLNAELNWLDAVELEAGKRGKARHPEYAEVE